MRTSMFATAVVCALACNTYAQTQPSGYHTVSCIKTEPGKAAEYREFSQDATRKLMQAWADTGQIVAWYLYRPAIAPGVSAPCDYVSVTVYPGTPPAPMSNLDRLGQLLQKAGAGMTAQDYIDRRGSLSHLVSSEIWRSVMSVGKAEKGDFAYVNFMKVHNMSDWMELEETIWKPMAQTWVEQGEMRGWLVNRPFLPSGTELKYQATTLDVFPTWDAAMRSRPVEETFKKVHSGKDYQQTVERFGKARDLARRELYTIAEKVVPAGAADTQTSADRAAPQR